MVCYLDVVKLHDKFLCSWKQQTYQTSDRALISLAHDDLQSAFKKFRGRFYKKIIRSIAVLVLLTVRSSYACLPINIIGSFECRVRTRTMKGI